MNAEEALAWLYGTQAFGIKLGLENMERLLAALEIRSDSRHIIHVAGTNGKGSVCAFIHALLNERGTRAGLFTSPHLVHFRERIRGPGGVMISQEEMCEGLNRLHDLVKTWDPHPTFFELTLALAMLWFNKKKIYDLVLETGMGGRLDATNALKPIVTVITPIDYDHQKWLGQSLAEIATEKAGIFKPGVPAITIPQLPEARVALEKRALELNIPLRTVTQPWPGKLPLAGEHQRWNAALAVAALQATGLRFSSKQAQRGLEQCRWPGRFQHTGPGHRVVVDGAHNAAGARVLATTWREEFGQEKATVIFSAVEDKDLATMLQEISPLAERWILTRVKTRRGLDLPVLEEAVRQPGLPQLPVLLEEQASAALQKALAFPEKILVAGSLYLVGEVLAQLQDKLLTFEKSEQ